jgi:hypothetical protein
MDERITEAIAEQVHEAWAAEKQRQGFANHTLDMCPDKYGRDWKASCPWPDIKHHGDMLPYAQLPENVKEYDRVTARAALQGIERAGYQLVKMETPT